MTLKPEECHPFLWIEEIDTSCNYLEEVVFVVNRKLKELNNLEYGYDEDMIIWNLLLACDANRKSNYSKGLDYLKMKTLEASHKFKKVYDHTVELSREYLLKQLDKGESDERGVTASEEGDHGKDIPEDHLLYVKAKFFTIFHDRGNELALKLLEKALLIQPNEGRYHFTVGNILSRKRHSVQPLVTPGTKEMHHLKQATKVEPNNAIYGIMLARTYSDCAKFAPRFGNRHQQNYVKLYQEMSASIIKSILMSDYDKLNGKLIARCVHILRTNSTFRGNLFDLGIFATDALKKAPDNPMVNHYIGMYYVSKENFKAALSCYEKAVGTIPYLMGPVLVMKEQFGQGKDNEQFIKDTLARYSKGSANSYGQVIIGISEYYLLVVGDLNRACEYYLKIDDPSNKLDKVSVSILKYPNNRLNFKKVLKTFIKEFIDSKQSDEAELKNEEFKSVFTLWGQLALTQCEKVNLKSITKSLNYK